MHGLRPDGNAENVKNNTRGDPQAKQGKNDTRISKLRKTELSCMWAGVFYAEVGGPQLFVMLLFWFQC